MPIGTTVQKGGFVYVYDEKGRQLAVIAAGDGLQGYTGSAFTIRRAGFLYTYDERGRQVSVIAGR